MKLRMVDKGDTERLVKLRFDYFASEGWEADEKLTAKVSSQLRGYYDKHLNLDFFAAFAEDESGEVMSTASLVITEKPANLHSFPTGKSGLILNVLTYPEHRKKGYATKVLRLCRNVKHNGQSSRQEF